MTQKRKIIVHIATSADGYIARPNGNLDWLTSRPAPKGFYGLPKFAQSIDAKILGRTTFDSTICRH
jgi:dihydrofolate reductase